MALLHSDRMQHLQYRRTNGKEESDMQQLVMVIDDALAVRTILDTCLRRAGYEVKSFEDGVQAFMQREAGRTPYTHFLPSEWRTNIMSSSRLEHTIQTTNTYIIDAESAAEQARLIDQEMLLTAATGGPLAEQSEERLDDIHDVLDVGCGPGGWVRAVAQTYPQMQITGIDISD